MPGRADCLGERLGTSFAAKQWLSLNPCGLAGITASFSVHVYALLVTALYLIPGHWFAEAIFVLWYVPLVAMALWSLFMAWTTDPGAVPMGARPLVRVSRAASGELSPSVQARKRGIRRCHKCNDNFKPNRAHHDSVTGRCIVKMDHYCPWVCNAIGALNHKFFVLFIFYTLNTCLTSIFLIVVRSVRCGYYYEEESMDDNSNNLAPTVNATVASAGQNIEESGNIEHEKEVGDLDETRFLGERSFVHPECVDFYGTQFVMVLFIVAVMFMIFTTCMLFEQVEAITTNQGKIARMKMRVGQSGGTEFNRVTDEFNEMFGGTSPNIAWHWFVPLPIKFPGSYKKVVLGYEWDPTFDELPYPDPDDGQCSPTSAASGDGDSGVAAGKSQDASVSPTRDIEEGLGEDGLLEEVTLRDSEDSEVPRSASPGVKKRSLARSEKSSSSNSLPTIT